MIKMKIRINLWLISALLLITTSIYAEPASGTFTARSPCQAYISKNKQTNPDNTHVIVGRTYTIREKNKYTDANWFRVFIAKADKNQLRWISKNCGIVKLKNDLSRQCISKPGYADSYVLALSWEPAFCETYGYGTNKQECKNLSLNNTASTSFSLHGFWPNQNACGINYGFCNTKEQINFCSYAPLKLNAKTQKLLHSVMPGYNSTSCLQRHEWYKHGTCQLQDQNQYFTQAANFVKQINSSKLEQLFSQNVGKDISIEQFNNAFNSSFGANSSKKVYLNCKEGMLVDIYISLPKSADDPTQKDLAALLSKAPDAKQSTCPNTFRISNFSSSVN